jgi:ABC-type transport system substrate-binding protein
VTGGKADYTEFNSQWIGRKLPEVSTYGWQTTGFDADNWFYNQVYSQSPGNRWNINDPQIDQWAQDQQIELDPEKRKAIWRKIWDRELQQAYRPPMPYGFTFEVYQPWMRGIRWTGTSPGDNSSYYNWGDQVQYGWLDK